MDKLERAELIAKEMRNREYYKKLCREEKENQIYQKLKRDFGYTILDKPISVYVEELKKEVAEEKMQQQGK